MHGGASLSGLAHPNLRTGRHSKDLPQRLTSRVLEALQDPKLTELRDELALVDVRIGQLLSQLEEPGAHDGKAAAAALQQLQAAIAAQDQAAAAVAMKVLEGAFAVTIHEHATWAEIQDAINVRRKLVESETRRLKALHQMVTTEEVMTLVSALSASVHRHVTDRVALAAIQDDIRRLMSAGAIPVATYPPAVAGGVRIYDARPKQVVIHLPDNGRRRTAGRV